MNLDDDTPQLGWSHMPSLSLAQRRLLLASGVPNTAALARHDAKQLWRWMQEVNAEERCCRRMPGVEEVQTWVHEAIQLSGKDESTGESVFLRKATA